MSLSAARGSCRTTEAHSKLGIPDDLGTEARRLALRQRVELHRTLACRDVAAIDRYLQEAPVPESWFLLALADIWVREKRVKRVKGARPITLWKYQFLAVEVEAVCASEHCSRESAIHKVRGRRKVSERTVRTALAKYGQAARAAAAGRTKRCK